MEVFSLGKEGLSRFSDFSFTSPLLLFTCSLFFPSPPHSLHFYPTSLHLSTPTDSFSRTLAESDNRNRTDRSLTELLVGSPSQIRKTSSLFSRSLFLRLF